MTEALSGRCLEASKAAQSARPDRLRAAANFHASCRGRWFVRVGFPFAECSCPCHARTVRPAMADIVETARAAQQERAGAVSEPPPAHPEGECRSGHQITPETTGSRGECLLCKREARRAREARETR